MAVSKKTVLLLMAMIMAATMFVGVTSTKDVYAASEYSNAKTMYKYLRNTKGFTKQGALASCAIAYTESRVDPKATNKNCGSYGIMQRMGSRKAKLKKKKNYGTLSVQEAFYCTELSDFGLYSKIKKSTSSDSAISTLAKKYTMPANVDDYIKRAKQNAKTLKKNGLNW